MRFLLIQNEKVTFAATSRYFCCFSAYVRMRHESDNLILEQRLDDCLLSSACTLYDNMPLGESLTGEILGRHICLVHARMCNIYSALWRYALQGLLYVYVGSRMKEFCGSMFKEVGVRHTSQISTYCTFGIICIKIYALNNRSIEWFVLQHAHFTFAKTLTNYH